MVGKVLIVDDVATNRIVMKVKLNAAGYRPVLAHDGASCLNVSLADAPDVILLDLALPDMSGVDVVKRLRAMPQTRSTPIIMVSVNQETAARAAAFKAGADDYLTKPVDDQTLLARIRSFMRSRQALETIGPSSGGFAVLGLAEAPAAFETAGVLALITARTETGMALRRQLADETNCRTVIMTVDEALSQGLNTSGAPDVFLIETDLGAAGSGLRLMSELRSRTNTLHSAFCLLVSQGPPVSAAVAFDLGANEIVPITTSGHELALRLARLIARKREADRMRASVQDGLRLAVIDPLTGLHNRRYGIAQLSAICERARNSSSAFAVMVVDLDRFKSVNDRWGHAAGDQVLVDVAQRLSRNLRSGDLLARIGGEEFLIALPETGFGDACTIAERLCRAIEDAPIAIPNGGRVNVTVSIGLAISEQGELPVHMDTVAEIVDRADRALLMSKSGGRNQVTISRSVA